MAVCVLHVELTFPQVYDTSSTSSVRAEASSWRVELCTNWASHDQLCIIVRPLISAPFFGIMSGNIDTRFIIVFSRTSFTAPLIFLFFRELRHILI